MQIYGNFDGVALKFCALFGLVSYTDTWMINQIDIEKYDALGWKSTKLPGHPSQKIWGRLGVASWTICPPFLPGKSTLNFQKTKKQLPGFFSGGKRNFPNKTLHEHVHPTTTTTTTTTTTRSGNANKNWFTPSACALVSGLTLEGVLGFKGATPQDNLWPGAEARWFSGWGAMALRSPGMMIFVRS